MKNIFLKITFLIFFFIIFSILSYEINKYDVYNTPDFTVNVFFSKLLSENHTLEYCNDLGVKYNVSIFGARSFAMTKDAGCAAPANMFGYIIIMSILRILSDNLIFFLNPLLAVFSIVFFYKLSEMFFNEKTAIISSLLFSFSAPFFYFTILLFNNVALLTFFLATIYYFFKLLETDDIKYYIIFSFFLSISIWIRYPEALFFTPLILGFLKKDYIKKIYTSAFQIKIFTVLLILLIMLCPLIIFNTKLFGSPLGWVIKPEMQYNYYIAKLLSPEQGESTKLIPFYGFDIMLNNLNYISKLNTLVLILFVPSIASLLINKRERRILFSYNQFWILLGIILLYALFYLGNTWTGYYYGFFSIHTSLARYLLPLHAIMILLGSYTLNQISKQIINKKVNIKMLIPIFILVFIVFNLNIVINGELGLKHLKSQVLKYIERKDKILSCIPEMDAIIFTKYSDKYIFPERTTAIYVAFPPEERIEKTTSLAKQLLKDNLTVYFIDEDWKSDYDLFTTGEYLTNFKKNNMSSTLLNDSSIYKVELIEPNIR